MFQFSFPFHLFREIYRSILIFFIEMYGSMNLCVYIDLVRGLTKMCKNSICLCHSMSIFLFAYGIATPFGSIH
ncbi:hypothetical protein E1A91_A07G166400v1 [Gossypium mustelinum]|uniref:Uncharacterized protein n=1 Tax=Gossypium mustelinum TaxID=34275 RepID=A0A5D2YL96_GOSMU|nr:hypothetical protein E1A91_A07G166400v1 [Gossypium mustelinum]